MPLPPSVGCASTAFLTQAPFTAFDAAQRSRVMMDGPDPVLTRPRTCIDHREGMSPFLFRRSATALGDLPPIGCRPPRSKSAPRPRDHIVIMPRSHVSVARFYDWTDDLGDCFSVSRLYREIAHIPRLDSKGALRGSQPNLGGAGPGVSCSNSSTSMMSITSATGAVVHHGAKGRGHHQFFLSPGRMFVRDKKALTRGEREIIEGIYKNRGDVGCSSKDTVCCSEFQVRSHQEAWLVGKNGAVPCASIADGAGGAMGRTIMKGMGLDTPTKNGAHKTNNGEGQPDSKSRTTTSSGSADDLSSSTSRMTLSRDRTSPREWKQRVEKQSTLPTGKRPLASPEAGGHPGSHEKVKRPLHVQNPVDYWDSRPCAPPSSPTPFEDSPPSTPVLQSTLALRPSPSSFVNLVTIPPDKLLAMRPSLPPNAIILAAKIQSPPSAERTNKQRNLNSGSPLEDNSRVTILNSGKQTEQPPNCETLCAEDMPVVSDNELIDRDAFDKDSDSNSNPPLSGFDVDAVSKRPTENEKDKKKVHVRVYLPSMGVETNEDDATFISTLTKERPLSQTAFKAKSHGQNIRLS